MWAVCYQMSRQLLLNPVHASDVGSKYFRGLWVLGVLGCGFALAGCRLSGQGLLRLLAKVIDTGLPVAGGQHFSIVGLLLLSSRAGLLI